jgi:DNA-binding beta-propeller fold protein YncE
VYAVSPSGVLTEQPNSPYTITASDPVSVLAVNTMPANVGAIGGLFVYVGQGAGGGALFPFQVCWVANNTTCSPQDVADNLLFPLTTCPALSCQVPPSAAGEYPVQMLVDPTNNFLYALSENSNQVFAFGIGTTTGKLTELQNQSTGTLPVSMALHPSVPNTGQYLYTSNSASANIIGFTLSTTSGAMSNPITVIAPEAPSGMAVH